MSGPKDVDQIDSSDDESYNPTAIPGVNIWEPHPQTIIDLYEKLDKVGVLELQWKCPGKTSEKQQTVDVAPIECVEATPESDKKVKKDKLLSMFEEDDLAEKSMEIRQQAMIKTPKTPRNKQQQKASFEKIFTKVSQQKTGEGTTSGAADM